MKPRTLGFRLAQLRREKSAREERDIDQTEIAKAIGIGAERQTYISRWENDVVQPKDDVLVKLAAYYGVTIGWLRYGEGPRRPGEIEVQAPRPPKDPPTSIVRVAGAKRRRPR